jgi:PhnB protein
MELGCVAESRRAKLSSSRSIQQHICQLIKEDKMDNGFKPVGYNSVSPYFIVDGAQKFIDLLSVIFDAKELRRFDRPDGTIMHAEVQIDDSVIMLGDASDKFPPVQLVMHVYVPDVDVIFDKAVSAGCEVVGHPKQADGDPDRRATFKDFAGNMWSVGTQL